MTESLFRKEVLEAKRTSWLGPISLAQPLPAWGLTAFAVVAAASIILFLIFEPDGLAHRWRQIKAYWKLYPFSY